MRKADYATLAALVRGFLQDDSPASKDPLARATVIMIAMCFAARTSVDTAEFLKACGIDP
jgi:hypothetical protein